LKAAVQAAHLLPTLGDEAADRIETLVDGEGRG